MLWRRSTTAKRRKKRPGRTRLLAGWLLLALGAFFGAAFWLSGRWRFGYLNSNTEFLFFHGYLQVGNLPPHAAEPRGWQFFELGWDQWELPRYTQGRNWLCPEFTLLKTDSAFFGASWWVADFARWHYPGKKAVVIIRVCTWFPAALMLLGGGWLVWSGRRARRRAVTGVCLKCGYDSGGQAFAVIGNNAGARLAA